MIEFPQELQDRLLHYIKATCYAGTKRAPYIHQPFDKMDLKFFSKGVANLSSCFTSERAQLKPTYLNQPANRAGYLLYFLPLNFTKAIFIFSKMPASFWSRKTYRLLDLGSGPGSASLAFLQLVNRHHSDATVELHLVDRNKPILRDAEFLVNQWKGMLPGLKNVILKTHSQEIFHFQFRQRYDLIILSHVFNEMIRSSAQERAEWLSGKLDRHLGETGILALMEPALKRPTRELMALRDHLLETGNLEILAPCLHENICPMLAGTKNDWCHFYLDWREPDYLKSLDRLVGNQNRYLKLAYLLLASKGSYFRELKRNPHLFRMVSNRMATRGKTEVVLCGSPGRLRVSRLDRNRSKNNGPLDEVRRGDLLALPGHSAKGYQVDGNLRLGKNQSLKIVNEKIKPGP